MNSKVLSVLHIDMERYTIPRIEEIEFKGFKIKVETHGFDGSYVMAKEVIDQLSGHYDAISLEGVEPSYSSSGFEIENLQAKNLITAARQTPIFTASVVRHFFTEWSLSGVLKRAPNILKGKNVLCSSILLNGMISQLEGAGANVLGADLLTLGGIPKIIRGRKELERYLRLLKRPAERFNFKWDKFKSDRNPTLHTILRRWILNSDIFVNYFDLDAVVGTLDILEGKTLITDYLSKGSEEQLRMNNVGKLLQLIPDLSSHGLGGVSSFALLHAIFALVHSCDPNKNLNFKEYLLRFVSGNNIIPAPLKRLSKSRKRCAFVVHPLVSDDIFRAKQLKPLRKAPKGLQAHIQNVLAVMPPIKLGEISGVESVSSGEEVVCDIYAIVATPKKLIQMDEKFIYKRMIETASLARKAGSCMMGLGAYTKVVGDAGYTIAQRSEVPVTNGNSYSAASTLWAAKVIVEKMGFVDLYPSQEGLIDAKVVVVGATGSIGRVSAFLIAEVAKKVVLVATTPTRLLELKREMSERFPKVEVCVTTFPNSEISDADLIVTATSNQKGSLFDINLVKPGCVICDCSRPLDITRAEASRRPDVMIIESGEIDLPGKLKFTCDIGLPRPSVYACLAETCLLALDDRLEAFSTSKELKVENVKEIYKIGLKHGAKLSAIRSHNGIVSDDDIARCRELAKERLKSWRAYNPQLDKNYETKSPQSKRKKKR